MMQMEDTSRNGAAMDHLPQRRNVLPREEEETKEIDPSVPLCADDDEEDKFHKKRASFDQRVERFVKKISDNFWPIVFLSVCTWALYMDQFVQVLLFSHAVNRAMIHWGVAWSTAVMGFSVYIDVVRKYTLGRNPRYQDARTSTHCLLASLTIAGLCFVIGLWPIWGWYALVYVNMWFFGVIVPVSIVFPMSIQMILYGGSYLWFMHAYLTQTLK